MTSFARLSAGLTAYESAGSGEPIVLVHGAEADMRSFAAVSGELARASFTVVRYDQRGCGESAGDGRKHGIVELADDAAELMASLGHPTFAVFGTSFGGRIAQALAIRHSERVTKLVLCNTWPLDADLEQKNPLGVARLQTLRSGLPATAEALAEMFYGSAIVRERPDWVQRFAQRAQDGRRGSMAIDIDRLGDMQIEQPTLVISGDQDSIVPTDIAVDMAAGLPNGRLAVLPGVAHAASVQAPAEVAALMTDFLRHQ